jgi:tRNA(fMet)-specific endonuclease VapC
VAAGLVVADTDVLIDFLRGSDPGRAWVRERLRAGELRLTAVSAFELRLGADFVARRGGIDALFLHRTLPLDLVGAYRAGEVLVELRRRGEAIGMNDALLAGICLRFDLPLATRNVRELGRVEGLRLVSLED